MYLHLLSFKENPKLLGFFIVLTKSHQKHHFYANVFQLLKRKSFNETKDEFL